MADSVIKIEDLNPIGENLKGTAQIPISQDKVDYRVSVGEIEQSVLTKVSDRYLEKDSKIPNENLTFGKVKEGDVNVVSGGEVKKYTDNYLFRRNENIQPITDAIISDNGTLSTHEKYITSNFIPVNLNDEIEYIGSVSGGANALYGYNVNKQPTVLLLGKNTNGSNVVEITNTHTKYIRASSIKTTILFVNKISKTIDRNIVPTSNVIVENGNEIPTQRAVFDFVQNKPIKKYKINYSWCSIGDSITEPNLYQTEVMKYIEFKGYRKFGLAGRGWADDDTRGSFYSYMLASPEPINNDIVTLFGGTNDFRLDKDLGTIDDYKNDTGSNTVAGAIRKSIDFIFNNNNKVQFIMVTPTRRDNAGYTSYSLNAKGWGLLNLRELLIEIANFESMPIIDMFMFSGVNDRNLRIYANDGIHPEANGGGHTLYAMRFIDMFKNIYPIDNIII